jgi:dihydrofolate reductase
MANHDFTIIVAHNTHGVIGVQGKMPWKISEEINFFKETTVGHSVIMGGKTWDSIPERYRPLPERNNIVLSRRNDPFPSAAVQCQTVEQSIRAARHFHKHDPYKEVFVIGGAEIYKLFLDNNLVDRVLVSHIKGYDDIIDGTKFPDLKKYGWSGKIFKEFEKFTVYEYRPILSFDKISEIAMDLSLKLTDLGIDGYQYNECMNCLRSNLVESFSMNSVAHNATTMARIDWIKLREERRNVQKEDANQTIASQLANEN